MLQKRSNKHKKGKSILSKASRAKNKKQNQASKRPFQVNSNKPVNKIADRYGYKDFMSHSSSTLDITQTETTTYPTQQSFTSRRQRQLDGLIYGSTENEQTTSATTTTQVKLAKK